MCNDTLGMRSATLLLTCLALGARAWALPNACSDGDTVLEDGIAPGPEAAAIRKLLEDYARAIETKDVKLLKSVKPNLSDDEARRAAAAFKSIKTQVVTLRIQAIDIADGRARVHVVRRDRLDESIVSSFPQTFSLARGPEHTWKIEAMGR